MPTLTTNPYVYDRPIAERERFCNRRSEIVRIYSRIASDRPQSVSIVGEARIGKTSLLNWLYHDDSRSEYLGDPAGYTYLMLPLKDRPPANPEDFFSQVGEALDSAGQGRIGASYDDFRLLAERLAAEKQKLVLFCDDFGLVTQNHAFPLEFFSFMRSIANSHDVAYVTTSSAELQKLCSTQDLEESPFFNIFTTVNLRPFGEEEARELLQRPRADDAGRLAGDVGWILKLAGSRPYLLQLTASLAFEAQTNGNGGLSAQAVSDRAFKAAREFLTGLWAEQFSEAQRAVLRQISEGKEVRNSSRYAADELERRGDLRKTPDGYCICSSLMERCVREGKKGGFWKAVFGRQPSLNHAGISVSRH